MTPFFCVAGDGFRYQIATMINGRPEDNGKVAFFCPDGHTKNVNSLTKKENVSGWCYY